MIKKAIITTLLFLAVSCNGTVDKAENDSIKKSATSEKALGTKGSFSLELEKTDGEKFSFEEIRGKKHLLAAFWATWCEPCKTELQKMARMYSDFSQEIEFVAISTDSADQMDKVNEFAIENALPFPVLIDPEGNFVSSVIPGGDTVPYSIIVDKFGNIISRHSGYKPGDEELLKKELSELLKK
jgi:peroxiredoxin